MSDNKKLYKPFRYTGNGNFRMSVYVKNEKTGKPKLIHFGDKRYKIKTTPAKIKSYLARAKGIKNKKGELTYNNKNTKNYWSYNAWL
tara:strand:+ start:769 stop:1029 length:261 start_codon:yes stop_codon:yes gene_type:complete